jgi:cell wall-associated NlpC family hydrolase
MLYAGCSSTSTSQRYSKPSSQKEEPVTRKRIRFTSVDTLKKKENIQSEPIITFPNAPDSLLEEFDEIPIEVNPVDKSKLVENIDKIKSFNVALTEREKVLFEVIKFLDTPYKYGGSTSKGIDCSAFTKQVFENSLSLQIPRSAREQYSFGDKILNDELKFGDLVFFNTTKRSFPGHVGIYLGDDQFAHASRSLGVTVSSLSDPYYKKRFVGARRVEEIKTE